jgi:hypothetical protein
MLKQQQPHGLQFYASGCVCHGGFIMTAMMYSQWGYQSVTPASAAAASPFSLAAAAAAGCSIPELLLWTRQHTSR